MSLGPFEIAVILVVVLIIFGPKNLPKLGSAMGKTMKSIREGMEDTRPELDEVVEEEYEDVDYDDEEDEEDEPPVRKRRTTKKTTRTRAAAGSSTKKRATTTTRTTRTTRTTKAKAKK